jgi:hypothetical protein
MYIYIYMFYSKAKSTPAGEEPRKASKIVSFSPLSNLAWRRCTFMFEAARESIWCTTCVGEKERKKEREREEKVFGHVRNGEAAEEVDNKQGSGEGGGYLCVYQFITKDHGWLRTCQWKQPDSQCVR